MGGHHKKNLRAEKAKVKLKGAKLPKGLNVTKTDFKVRKIEIREQLKEFPQAENYQRQFDLKEILQRLKHHNLKFRTDALRNVRDAIKDGQAEHLVGHLNQLVNGIAGGALDVERVVRRESFKTLDVLLGGLSAATIAPFFHIIAIHLRCAMTHVQPIIQEDSLELLDVLLKRVPARVLGERSSTIIGNFIDMISRKRHDTQNTNRLLTVRLGQGQMMTVKWRIKVLMRLHQILNTLLLVQQDKNTLSSNVHTMPNIFFDENTPQYYNVQRPEVLDTRNMHNIFNERAVKDESDQLRGYVEQLMPLLHDSWIELRPQKLKQQQLQTKYQQETSTELLTEDAAATLHVVLDIMVQLCKLVDQYETIQQEETHEMSNWMRDTYGSSFVRIFVEECDFPHVQMPKSVLPDTKSKRNAKQPKLTAKATPVGGARCIEQNLTLVQLVCYFWPQPDEDQSAYYFYLMQFVAECLVALPHVLPNEQLRLVAALRALLLTNGMALMEHRAHQIGTLVSHCIEAYTMGNFTTREGVANKILLLLIQLLQHPQHFAAFGGDALFSPFIEHMPKLLLYPSIGDFAIRAMSSLCRQRNLIFLKTVIHYLHLVMSHIEKIQFTGTSHDDAESRFENQERIMNIFGHAREFRDPKELKKSLKIVKENNSERVAKYLESVLKL